MNSRQANLNQTQPTNKKENITVENPYVGNSPHIRNNVHLRVCVKLKKEKNDFSQCPAMAGNF